MSDHNLEKLETFDRKMFLSNYSGMEQLISLTIASYLESLPEMLQSLETAINAKDIKNIGLAAHKLMGSTSNFCAHRAVGLSLALEKIGKSQDTSQADNLLAELKKELDRLIPVLKIIAQEFPASAYT